jgi:hypothetical protein
MLESRALCSCPSCGELSGAPALHEAPIRKGVPARCSSNTRPQTQSAPARSRRSPSPEKPLLGTRRAHSHPASFFSAKAHRADRPREGRFAHRDPGHLLQVLPPLGELGERTLLHVRLQEPPGLLIECGSFARSLPRRERAPLTHRLDVALDRREAYLEKARAASLLFMRRCCTASTIFLLRSSE